MTERAPASALAETPRAFGVPLHPWGPGLFRRLVHWAIDAPRALVSLALVRVVYGSIILFALLGNAADRHYLWGVGSTWVDPDVEQRDHPAILQLLFPKSDPLLFDLCYLLAILAAAAMVVGWRTRLVAPAVLLLWQSLSTNSTLLDNSGDTVLRITMLFLLFTDLSARFSVDELLRRRRGRGDPVRHWLVVLAHNTAIVLCAAQLVIVYASSSWYKLQGSAWLDGTASYFPLMIDAYRPLPWLSDLVAQWGGAVIAMTYASFLAQALFPLCLLWRPTRVAILLIVTAMHFGVAVLMGLWAFSFVMLALDLLFIRDRSWAKLAGYVTQAATTLGSWSPPSTAATDRRPSPS